MSNLAAALLLVAECEQERTRRRLEGVGLGCQGGRSIHPGRQESCRRRRPLI